MNKPKYLSIVTIISLCLFELATAQSSNQDNINQEARDNQIIYDNSITTRPQAKKDTYLKVLGNPNGGGKQELNLTDEEKVLSENFVHQGLANRKMQEGCAGETNSALCEGRDPEAKKKIIVQAVAKAYAMFGGMMDDKFLALKKTPSEGKTEGGEQAKTEGSDKAADGDKAKTESSDKGKKEENQSDYCKYIPMATETVSGVMQQMNAQALSVQTRSNETAQKEAIMKAAKSHEERSKGSQIQAVGWGSTAACYGAMAATGTNMNTAWWIKIGAATFLGAFYYKDSEDNKDYAKKTRAIANTLPGKGDCNPVTDKACYCSQPETEMDSTYCYEQLHQKKLAQLSARVTCIDSNLKSDPSCSCEKSNTCFEKLMINQDVNNTLGFGSVGSQFSPIKKLTNGEATSGVLNGSAYNQYAAIAKKLLADKSGSLKGPNLNLNKEEREMAAIYQEAGMPGNIAAHIASSAISPAAMNQALAKVNGMTSNLPKIGGLDQIYKNRVVDFSGGAGLKNTKQAGNKDDLKGLINNLSGKKATPTQNGKVLIFAEKAQNQNQITKSDSNLFEIISNRYMNSAPRLLNLEESK